MVTPVELVRAAAAAGLQVVCVTDHDTIPDLAEAIDAGAELGVEVVRGEEVTCVFPPGTHIVGLFIDTQIRMHMSVEDTVDAIHDQGGLAIVAHPFMPTYFASMSPRRLEKLLESRTVEGVGAAGLRSSLERRTTSPLNGIRPCPPGLRARLAQQQRSMIWLSHQRRTGRVGQGVGSSR